MDDGLLRFVVVGEDHVHRALAMGLCDAVACKLAHDRDADWFDPEHHREWWAPDMDAHTPANRRFRPLKNPTRRRYHGHIGGRPAGPGAQKMRGVFLDLLQEQPRPNLVVMLQDSDGDGRIAESAIQVLHYLNEIEGAPPLVIGIPNRDAEAWFLAAGVESRGQRERLAAARKILPFDPTHQPERLTSSPNDSPTDAKRVVRFVLLEDGDKLATGRPASLPPSPDEADLLAQRLGRVLVVGESYEACGLADFVRALAVASQSVWAKHLPRARRRT